MDFDLAPAWWLLALPVAFALGWIGSRLDVRQWQREQRDARRAYDKGLNLLLSEQHDKAIDAFIAAVQRDPESFDLHFALGSMFRRRGEYERAVRVHQYLLGRADLPKAERHRAQHALAQDYMKAGLFDRAEAAFRALADTPFATEARHALLDLHERAREWSAAIQVARELEATGVGSYASRIAHYHCELAIERDAAGDRDGADTQLAAALAAAPNDARPLVLAGERAAARGDHDEALRAWNLLASARPGDVDLVASRYAQSARAAGREAEALERLEALYAAQPTMPRLEAILALAPGDARDRLAAHLADRPTLAAAAALIAADAAAASQAPATGARALLPEAPALSAALKRAGRPLHRYRCAACGFEAEHYFWQCPGCLGWDTYPPIRLEDQT